MNRWLLSLVGIILIVLSNPGLAQTLPTQCAQTIYKDPTGLLLTNCLKKQSATKATGLIDRFRAIALNAFKASFNPSVSTSPSSTVNRIRRPALRDTSESNTSDPNQGVPATPPASTDQPSKDWYR